MAVAVPVAPPSAPQTLSWEDYINSPLTKEPYEIIEGELFLMPSPEADHQWISRVLLLAIDNYVMANGRGVVLTAPFDVVIRRAPRLQTRQPDILFISAERRGIRGRKELRGIRRLEFAPDLVVEILSPGEIRGELAGKLRDYAEIGAREIWIVTAQGETVEVLNLQEAAYVRGGLYGIGDSVRSAVLPEFSLAVETIFAE